ncbi:adenosylhomocysteinase [Alkalispirochaeta sphaeroplastigenens]|nr:adenosylhomocysteinase [Alkalispirochaeta sphaeroplastigenens]
MSTRRSMPADILRNPASAPEGHRKIQWVRRNMPVLRSLEERFSREQPFAGMRAAVSVHLEAKTAYLALVMAAGGAQVSVTGSNPLSTKDDVVAALQELGLHVYAWHGATPGEFEEHQLTALRIAPHVVIDDGGDLVHHLHQGASEFSGDTLGGCEETTAGVLRNQARFEAGQLRFPVIAVNNARMKHLFDNRYGTGHSTVDALMRTTNRVLTGATVVVAGYGWCGRGIASCAAGLGARVIVCEVDEVKALEAVMDGYRVMPLGPLEEGAPCAAREGDFFVTATGVCDVITPREVACMKDGAVLANAGHFYDEIDLEGLAAMAGEVQEVRENLTGYRLEDGRWINLIAQGKIVNIAAADGHPAEIMDTSFAVQALSAEYVALSARRGAPLPAQVIPVPDEIDQGVARVLLAARGIRHDALTARQRAYLDDFNK